MPSHQRESRTRASDAQKRDSSGVRISVSSGQPQDASSLRGSVARSHSIEPWDTAEAGRSKRATAATAPVSASGSAADSSSRRDSRKNRHGAAAGASAVDASSGSSSFSSATNHPGEPPRRGGSGTHGSIKPQHVGGSVGQRRSSNASLGSNRSDDPEEEATCPLCLETLDETDRGLFPCECGYQVCLWCLHHIRDHLANKCPACRRDYDEKKFKYDQTRVLDRVMPEGKMRLAWLDRLTKQIGRKSREKVCGAPDPTRTGSSAGGGGGGSSSSCNSSTRTVCAVGQARGGTARSGSTSSYSCSGRVTSVQHPAGADRRGSREAAAPAPAQAAALKDVRVIQRCLVYVIGIPPSIAKKEILRRQEFFGQYGKVLQIVVNKNQGHWGGPSFAVYVTYSTSKEAVAAIQGVDGAVYEGRTLKASFGTTKYCSHFLKGVKCQNPDCSYLHQLGSGKDSFTKEAMISAKHQFLDLTFPSNSERKQTGSLFGKILDSGNRGGMQREEKEGQVDVEMNEAGKGDCIEDEDSDEFSSSPQAAGRGGSTNTAATVPSSSVAVVTSSVHSIGAAQPTSAAAEGEDTSVCGGSKSRSKPLSSSCNTWASVAAGSVKPSSVATTAAATVAASASVQESIPVCSGGTDKMRQLKHQSEHHEESEDTQHAKEEDTKRLTIGGLPGSITGNVDNALPDACDFHAMNEHEVAAAGTESLPPVCDESKVTEAETENSAAEKGGAHAASSDRPADAGNFRQQQEEQQHREEDVPQQAAGWPALKGTLQAMGTEFRGAPLQSIGELALPASPATAGADECPQQLQTLLPAQQQQRLLHQMEQNQRRLATMQFESTASQLVSSESAASFPAEQFIQQQQRLLRLCAPGCMAQAADQVEPGGGRFGPPPGLEALGGPNSKKGFSARGSSSSSNSSSGSRFHLGSGGVDLSGDILGQLVPNDGVASVPFTGLTVQGASSGGGGSSSSSSSTSRFAFASKAADDDDALFEIPGVEDCVQWFTTPSRASAAEEQTLADTQQHHQQQLGSILSNRELPPLLSTGGGSEQLSALTDGSWTQQQQHKDFVLGPGVGLASLTAAHQRQQHQQRHPSDWWRNLQLPPGMVMQNKADLGTGGGASAAATAMDRLETLNAGRGGWNAGNSCFLGHEQQQQHVLQQEHLQQLLRQQQHMAVHQYQQPQPRVRTATNPAEQQAHQQSQLMLQQQQQQEQECQFTLLQQLVPPHTLSCVGSEDPKETVKLLLSLMPNTLSQAQRMPPPQQQQVLRYGDNSNAAFPLNAPMSRNTDALARMLSARGGATPVLPRTQVGTTSGPLGRNVVDDAPDNSWGDAVANAAAPESGRGRSAPRKRSGSVADVEERGGGPTRGFYSQLGSHVSDFQQIPSSLDARGGTGLSGMPGRLGPSGAPAATVSPSDGETLPSVGIATSLSSGNDLLPFLQRRRMQQIQQQQLQQLQRALESQRLE
ncbi:RRM domain-containing protein, putative [Eimeria tenella]|uniref:RRM domain-containing protein, putative n=1 Tax=Eimeria tenella TaxID=5802 RepID=U6KR09_EIMTE|nr:RRM domain-containing protein, putative [Eimeria tenella]CDJ40542.1 RRM domain-containing protein, putative [Eimeria tenella]|eukprot:XP_013231292.1 RRM domain-containing protein, putative [Eimeria tenella]